MPDWNLIFDNHYKVRAVRNITFRKATGLDPFTASAVQYGPDKTILAGILYESVGLRLNRGVLMPQDRIEIHIWLRDWFGRDNDVATPEELQAMVGELKGQVNVANGDKETYSRFLLDGSSAFKYSLHAWDHRPDGQVFAILIRLQAA